MSADLVKVYPWQQPMSQAVSVMSALGYVRIAWPSGRQTLELYAGDVVLSDQEVAHARDVDQLRAAKKENLLNTLADFRERMVKSDWFIRARRRQKARRIVSAEFIHPDHYAGPSPQRGGVIA